MLSKNNKILIGCLALLLVMSVGYALFSDTITVTGTATAKGNFDVTATCQTGLASNIEYIEIEGNHFAFNRHFSLIKNKLSFKYVSFHSVFIHFCSEQTDFELIIIEIKSKFSKSFISILFFNKNVIYNTNR